MSVVGTAWEDPVSGGATFELNKHEFKRVFTVQTNNYNDREITVANAIGIPTQYSTYVCGNDFDLYARARHYEVKRKAPNSLYWTVEVTYSTPEPLKNKDGTEGAKREVEGQNDNPLLALPELDMKIEKFQEPITQIYNVSTGALQPCKASNGQIFDPPPQRDRSRCILTISRNEPLLAPHPATAILYTDVVNSDVFWSSAPGTAKIQSVTAKRLNKTISNGSIYAYLSCTYVIEFRPNWDVQILDAGDYFLNDIDGEQQRISFLTSDSHPRQGLLDGSGGKLGDGLSPIYNTVRPYSRLPFAVLNLPQSFRDVS